MTTPNTEISDLVADIRGRVQYMRELGVESMEVKLGETPEALVESRTIVGDLTVGEPPELRPRPPQGEVYKPGSRLAALPSLAKQNVRVPGVPGVPGLQAGTGTTGETLFDVTPKLPEPTETIEQIRAEIGPNCTRCPLHAMGRSQVVNSVGNFNADLMFVGEAPGADEDRLGEPFVGRAGQLLTDIIEKGLGIPRKDVFIGNINRCRPPGNRTPFPEEAAVCKPFLVREIAVVRPKVIVVLGAHAAQTLLETKTPISKLRGRFHDHLGVKVMPTFHPAYLLRDPHKKREVWEDMKMVRDHLTQAV